MSDAPAGLAVRTQKRYGWRPDHPDMRDYLLAVEPARHWQIYERNNSAPGWISAQEGEFGERTASTRGKLAAIAPTFERT